MYILSAPLVVKRTWMQVQIREALKLSAIGLLRMQDVSSYLLMLLSVLHPGANCTSTGQSMVATTGDDGYDHEGPSSSSIFVPVLR